MRTLAVAVVLAAAATAAPDFTRHVRPILQKRCYACHGPAQQINGLRLDHQASALKGGYAGPVIIPGKSSESALMERVTSTKEGFAMPPAGPKLTEAEIEILRSWIDDGAKYPAQTIPVVTTRSKPSHWAFQPIARHEPPTVKQADWVSNPIDAFILAKLESKNIAPSPEASKSTLLRRVSLDVRGIPPSPAEIGEFLSDNRPDAYSRMVDRMLASPHYGEKWARPWLDLARYADSDGYEKDLPRPYAWRWRNWVIQALNDDMPFDRFTIEQIAGDLLPSAQMEQRVATGFHRNVLVNREAGVSRAEDRFEQTINRTNTVSTAWLGLTTGCAQCHDHKYDPISQREYYQLFAFFNNVVEDDIDAPVPGELGEWLRARPGYLAKRQALLDEYKVAELQPVWESSMRAAVEKPGANLEWDFAVTSFRAMVDNAQATLLAPPGERTERERDRLTNYFIYNLGPDFNREKELVARVKQLREKLTALDQQTPQLTQAYAIREASNSEPTRIAVRGDYKRPGIAVEPGTLQVLPPLKTDSGKPDRLAFAKWLVSADNPLTARVNANRMWQQIFGRGIVRTSEDFGTQGERPSHPELLDWLASEFMSSGWSQKHLLRTILLSSAYRQSSHVRPELLESDPENALLARQSRLRLSAELIRDSALAAAGLLDERVGGASIRPPQPPGVAELTYANHNKWKESQGPDRYRRGLYIHFQRTAPYPQLMNFDAPEASVACSRRRTSNTPLQALNLLNDSVFLEAAQALAWQASQSAPEPAQQIAYAFRRALGRDPKPAELNRLSRLSLDSACRVLLNLDEFITRE
jgi:hypothetical protein